MQFDSTYVPYASTRYPVYANRGIVAASSPQASAAGLEVMRRGGNAVDAAVAAAAALTVVEPTANGIGSDAFALVWIEKEKTLYGLNGSGWAPRDLTIDKVKPDKNGGMPAYGWMPVMVPGAPKAWAALSKRFGSAAFADALAPAIDYARYGYPAGANLAKAWERAAAHYATMKSQPEFAEWFRTFTPNGTAPTPGSLIKLKNHADTLEKIANSGAEAFYRGELADRIVADSRKHGGFLCKEDFSEYDVVWVDPVSVNYRGFTVCEIPPNGQGIVALMALNILKEFSFQQRESADAFHKQWEAMKLAFADGLAYITDPKAMEVDYHDLIDPTYGAARAREIGDRAKTPCKAMPPKGGTVYLCTADGQGNMVSYIQSNYMGFGSGIVVEGTGISLQNRGYDFSLNPKDVNCLMPRKKSYHTIIPGFLLKDGEAVGPFGVMGGYMQPQGHVQVVTNLVDFHMNPQQALDAPRWQWMRDGRFLVEESFSGVIVKQLAVKGHTVQVTPDSALFGRGQIILRGTDGSLIGGTEPRTDSNIACY